MNAMDGQIRCQACGTDNPPDSVFCSNCGAEIATAPAPALTRRPYKAPAPQPKRRIDVRLIAGIGTTVVVILLLATVIAPYLWPSPVPSTSSPLNAAVQRGTAGQTLSQGGLTITLTSFRSHVPYTQISNGTSSNTYYVVNTTWAGTTYWNPSDPITYTWGLRDGSLSTGHMSQAPTDFVGATYHEGTYSIDEGRWEMFWKGIPTTSTTSPVEFLLHVPTADGDTLTFTWSL